MITKRIILNNGQSYLVKEVKSFTNMVANTTIEVATRQCRVIAEETRDLIQDKLLAGNIPSGGTVKILRSRNYSEFNRFKKEVPFEPLNIQEMSLLDKIRAKKVQLIAPRKGKSPVVDRKPYVFDPLNPRYREMKKDKGLDSRILIATGDYLKNIVVYRRKKQGELYYVVTMAKKRHYSGHTYLELATIHEYGRDKLFSEELGKEINVPARPHWRPSVKKMMDIFDNYRLTFTVEDLRKELRKII